MPAETLVKGGDFVAVETRYFCSGTCGAIITQEEYDKGLTKCGEKTCTMHGNPFEKGIYCTTCEKRIQEGEESDHQH